MGVMMQEDFDLDTLRELVQRSCELVSSLVLNERVCDNWTEERRDGLEQAQALLLQVRRKLE